MNEKTKKAPLHIGKALLVCIWLAAAFYTVQLLISGGILGLNALGIGLEDANLSVLGAVLSGVIYTATLLLVIGLPWWVKRWRTTKAELGIQRSLEWRDLLLSPPAFILYVLLSWAAMTAAMQFIPGYDATQTQDVLFTDLNFRYEYVLAFLTLVIIAPIAEELLFRGYLYGKLKRYVPVWLAILFASILFGAVHGQWNVAVDTFMLSVVMCGLREYTGTIWAGVVIHMAKNGLAYYLLFVNPSLVSGMLG